MQLRPETTDYEQRLGDAIGRVWDAGGEGAMLPESAADNPRPAIADAGPAGVGQQVNGPFSQGPTRFDDLGPQSGYTGPSDSMSGPSVPVARKIGCAVGRDLALMNPPYCLHETFRS